MDSEKVEAALAEAKKLAKNVAEEHEAKEESASAETEETLENPESESNGQGGIGKGEKRKSTDNEENEEDKREKVEFKIVYNKKKIDVSFPVDGDIASLKVHLQTIIGIPPAMMKVMIKGLAKDDMTLRKLGVTKGSKVMVIGSSLEDVLSVSKTPTAKELKAQEDEAKQKSSVSSKEKMHKKILEKGKPEDVMPGIKNVKQSLPTTPLTGMLNKYGGKVRLTFKMELDQLWIGTKERTDKVPMNSIKNVLSEPIEDHPEYHVLALQLGPTEASRYWVYWVPAQYVEAIKDAILGKWASW